MCTYKPFFSCWSHIIIDLEKMYDHITNYWLLYYLRKNHCIYVHVVVSLLFEKYFCVILYKQFTGQKYAKIAISYMNYWHQSYSIVVKHILLASYIASVCLDRLKLLLHPVTMMINYIMAVVTMMIEVYLGYTIAYHFDLLM